MISTGSGMKCEKHIDRLRKAIQSGRLKPGEMLGTEFGFAEEWKLARTTVRRGIDTLVSEGLLERQPGRGLFVSAPKVRKTRVVQVVMPNLAWASHVKIARGAQLAGNEHAVQTLVYDAHGQMKRDLEFIRKLPESHADGAIIVSMHDRRFSEVLFELKAKEFPFVLVGQRLHDLDVPTVVEDNYGGGYAIGQKLAAIGHRRVAFVGPLDLYVVAERLNGFRDAMLDACEYFDRSMVVSLQGGNLADWLSENIEATEAALLPLLTRPEPPTAVFDGSGDVVPLIYRAIRRAKLKIPQDISVVAFDDSPFSQFIEPEVARLRQPLLEHGRIAFEMLLKQMNGAQIGGLSDNVNEIPVLAAEWSPGPSLAGPQKLVRSELRTG
jgi:DNA-binding LacI/PurR family transcriptional regulator